MLCNLHYTFNNLLKLSELQGTYKYCRLIEWEQSSSHNIESIACSDCEVSSYAVAWVIYKCPSLPKYVRVSGMAANECNVDSVQFDETQFKPKLLMSIKKPTMIVITGELRGLYICYSSRLIFHFGLEGSNRE